MLKLSLFHQKKDAGLFLMLADFVEFTVPKKNNGELVNQKLDKFYRNTNLYLSNFVKNKS